jgi:signal transduction histidine kinase
LQNVIENAKKYRKKWTKILIVLDDNFSISNTVKNNIKQSDLDKIFDTFYQVDDSRSNKWYGLWLSIVKKITLLNSLKIKVKVEEKNFTLSICS